MHEYLNWFNKTAKHYFAPAKMAGYLRSHGVVASIRRSLPFFRQVYHELTFDWIYGVSTGSIVPREELGADLPNIDHAVRYRPTHVYSAKGAIELLRSHVPRFEEESFIDFGCGAGRVLIIAAEAGFRDVIGVEFSPVMAELGRRNMDRYVHRRKAARSRIRIEETDATEFDIPGDSRVFFFYRPFQWILYEVVLDNIESSVHEHPRDVYVLEVTPKFRRFFAARAGWVLTDSFDDYTTEVVDIYTYRAGGR